MQFILVKEFFTRLLTNPVYSLFSDEWNIKTSCLYRCLREVFFQNGILQTYYFLSACRSNDPKFT